jgi:hypothetical protein
MLYGLLQTLLVSFAGIIILLTLFLLCRLWLILPGLSQRTTPPLKLQRATCSIAILLGSGELLDNLKWHTLSAINI